ncbi:hypothetical protein ASPZODRAFT_414879 [Penicilliopsis zonata CBS 506.65]|uniref:Uncharacterized protein n=1 Tax=Penicilliopsis zonata CBS 506.65 TaxID=1073090 RepID=A0A1L9SWJ6_9EURO|nr:hypothetical protein ASPZODRAFT_414879 [Penicilliopsis zonata CBS 506.65]OJJ51546.1 hypothetical protein ASPZODRAFT_414879 [Penicilliopsis zonata CBS 506.65]
MTETVGEREERRGERERERERELDISNCNSSSINKLICPQRLLGTGGRRSAKRASSVVSLSGNAKVASRCNSTTNPSVSTKQPPLSLYASLSPLFFPPSPSPCAFAKEPGGHAVTCGSVRTSQRGSIDDRLAFSLPSALPSTLTLDSPLDTPTTCPPTSPATFCCGFLRSRSISEILTSLIFSHV